MKPTPIEMTDATRERAVRKIVEALADAPPTLTTAFLYTLSGCVDLARKVRDYDKAKESTCG